MFHMYRLDARKSSFIPVPVEWGPASLFLLTQVCNGMKAGSYVSCVTPRSECIAVVYGAVSDTMCMKDIAHMPPCIATIWANR